MSIEIPNEVFDLYFETVDAMTNEWFGVQCTCIYPPSRTPCSNCVYNSVLGTSSNVYNGTGPFPFENSICPNCQGEGFLLSYESDNIMLRVYYSRKDWKKVGIPLNISDSAVQVYGYATDLTKIRRAVKIGINNPQGGHDIYYYKLVGEPIFHGLKKRRYIIAYLDKTHD